MCHCRTMLCITSGRAVLVLLRLETCTRTRCPMASAALRRKYRTARGRAPLHLGWGTTGAISRWIATARSRLPHPASVSLPCPFAPHAGHVARNHLQLRASHYRSGSCRVDSEPWSLPLGTNPRLPSCSNRPVLFPGESCIPVGEVSPPPLPTPFIGATATQCCASRVGVRFWFC